MVPMAYSCLLVSEPSYIVWSDTHSAFEGPEDEMAAVDACHPALAEHERVTDRLDVFWCQGLVVFTIEEDVGEYAEAVLDPTRSAVVSTPSTWVAHEAAPVLGCRENLGAHNVLCGARQGAERTISLEDLEQ
jgi:hypothetical protein